MKMNKAIGMLAGTALLVCLGVPAQAAILNQGLTYTIDAVNLDTMSAQFTIHITGINAVTDLEGGRYGVESFAFNNTTLLDGLNGASPFGAFQTGGLNSGGCNGSGEFFCFSATVDPTAPPLAAGSVIDIPFSLTITSGTFEAWANSDPHFKINWLGTKNNYDLVSLGGGLDIEQQCTDPNGCDGTHTPIPAAVWLFGTVLAGGAGFGRWRKKRKQAV